jgi:hypothetical protein
MSRIGAARRSHARMSGDTGRSRVGEGCAEHAFEALKSRPSLGVGSVASSAPAVAAPAELAAENFRLQVSDYNPVIADLDAVLSKASVATVVDSADRKGASCSPHPNAVAAYCWQSGDESTTSGIHRASPPARMPAQTGNTRAKPSCSSAGITAAAATTKASESPS